MLRLLVDDSLSVTVSRIEIDCTHCYFQRSVTELLRSLATTKSGVQIAIQGSTGTRMERAPITTW